MSLLSTDDDHDLPATPGTAFRASKLLALAALGWFGYMVVFVARIYAAGGINLVLPIWNALFAAGMTACVVELYRDREWARRLLQSAVLLTGFMNVLVAVKPGGDHYWIGVVILGMCGWALHVAGPEYRARDLGVRPGIVAKAVSWAAVIGSVIIAVIPNSMLV